QWRYPDASYEADQIHLKARLIAVASGDDDTCGVSQPTQLGTHGRIYSGVHPYQMLAPREARQCKMTAQLDGSRHIDDDVDAVGLRDRIEVLGDRWNTLSYCAFQRR